MLSDGTTLTPRFLSIETGMPVEERALAISWGCASSDSKVTNTPMQPEDSKTGLRQADRWGVARLAAAVAQMLTASVIGSVLRLESGYRTVG